MRASNDGVLNSDFAFENTRNNAFDTLAPSVAHCSMKVQIIDVYNKENGSFVIDVPSGATISQIKEVIARSHPVLPLADGSFRLVMAGHTLSDAGATPFMPVRVRT